MRPETVNATFKNPRWWIVMPVLLPVTAAWLALGWLLCKPMWWIGQATCRLSNAMSPFAPTPAPIKAAMDWVRDGAVRSNNQIQRIAVGDPLECRVGRQP